MNIHSAKVKVT